jgi:epsilon-lactone hydrolase
MSSKQSEANKRHYETSAAQPPPATPQQAIEYHDIHWTGLTAEPGGVDYLEVDAGGTRGLWVVPHEADAERAIFYSHGGGFVGGSSYTHRKMVGHLAKAAGCKALLYEYAYAHEHKYPHQLDTALSTYRWLAQRIEPRHIAVAGDSAGAILTLGTVQRLRAAGEPLPAAIAIISGWLDLTVSAASFERNRKKDAFFQRETVDWLAGNVLGAMDRRDPLASPVFADFTRFPPICLQAGADEALVDESRMLAERAKAAGVDVSLEVFPDMLHSFQMMAGRAPEADEAIRKLGDWLRPKLGVRTRT